MEIFNNFGFEPVFFTAQIINFLILFFVFKKFLYKPLLKVLRDREKTIAQGLGDAEAAKKTLEGAGIQKDEVIKIATLEAEKIIAETKKNADVLREELMNAARQEADRVISDAKTMAEEEFEKAKGQVKDISLKISQKVLGKVLDELFTKQEKEKILSRNVKKLGSV